MEHVKKTIKERMEPHLLAVVFLFTLYSVCAQNQKPNVVLVLTDDQGYGDLACHGNPWIATPNIDKFYTESVRLTDFHVSPTCSPTRGALLTGHTSNRAGSWHTIVSREMVFEDETMLPEILVQNGYSTGIFGKWHLGDNHPFRPEDRGFEETFIHLGGGVGQSPDHWGNNYFGDTYVRNGIPEKVNGYCTDIWFREAMEYIDQKVEKGVPFFCYISTNSPHSPYYAPNSYVAPYIGNPDIVNPAFYGMITNIDENMGKLMHQLESKGIADNTILIFMTDNGTSNGAGVKLDRDGFKVKGFNAGMRGSKVSMYEGGHRVPFLIRWPDRGISGGRDVDDLTAHVDLFPTLVEALQLKGADSLDFDGVSLLDRLSDKGKKMKDRILITDNQRNLIPEKWKMSSTMKGKWRLINGKRLYNIATDPEQRKNIAHLHSELVAELQEAYEEWWESLQPRFDKWQHITLCHKTEPMTIISAMEMVPDSEESKTIWRQEHVRDQITNFKGTGFYNVMVEEKGRYRFTLKRYPLESNLGLGASSPEGDPIPKTNVKPYKAGLALPIARATIQLDQGEIISDEIDSMALGHSFDLELNRGHHKLRTHFVMEDGSIYPSMYTIVEKLN